MIEKTREFVITLSGCIEREMSRVIIALPPSNKVIDIFEQTIKGVLDQPLKLPNLIQKNSKEHFQKDYNYEICYNEYRKKGS